MYGNQLILILKLVMEDELMKALIIFGHPNPDSFNGLILDVVKKKLTEKGCEFIVKNLYASNFNPMLTMGDFIKMKNGTVSDDVAIEHLDVGWADALVFIYPVWWCGPPAIVKGWFDRVMTDGFAFTFKTDGSHVGLLQNKRALVLTTSAMKQGQMNQKGLTVAMENIILQGIMNYCGINNSTYRNFFEVPDTDDLNRNQMLKDVEELIDSI